MSLDAIMMNGGISGVTLFGRKSSFGKRKKIKKVKKVKRKVNYEPLRKKLKMSKKRFNSLRRKLKPKSVADFKKKLKRYRCSFGKKKRWIQKVNKSIAKKGTKGAFTRWCKSRGFKGVTTSCIALGKKSKSLRTRRRAIFAQNVHR
jgi:hypothetical protein